MSPKKTEQNSQSAFDKLPAQDVLPFPPKQSGSIAGRTMLESGASGG